MDYATILNNVVMRKGGEEKQGAGGGDAWSMQLHNDNKDV
jgi:hypothetical protein